MTNKNKTTTLVIYIIIFYALWTAFELIGKEIIDNTIRNTTLSQFVKSGIIKNLVWTFPAIMLVKYFKDNIYITLKEMFNIRVNWLKYLPIFILFTIYLLAGSLLQNGRIAVVNNFSTGEIVIVLFVGLTEEMVFRGWLLNATIREDGKWICIILNAVMFLVIHFPVWIYKGVLISNFTKLSFVSVILLSVVFSWTFIKSRNILIPIAFYN